MIVPIPSTAWRLAEGAFAVRVALPRPARRVVWIEGWSAATAAAARADGARFTALPRSACAAPPGIADTVLLRASRPPEAGLVLGLPAAGSATLAAGWPRGLMAARRAGPRAAAPDAALVARMLDQGETDMLLSLLGEALLGGAEREAVLAAARQVFLDRARHPLAPAPGLAVLAAALTG